MGFPIFTLEHCCFKSGSTFLLLAKFKTALIAFIQLAFVYCLMSNGANDVSDTSRKWVGYV